jgi:hypothetical protein
MSILPPPLLTRCSAKSVANITADGIIQIPGKDRIYNKPAAAGKRERLAACGESWDAKRLSTAEKMAEV